MRRKWKVEETEENGMKKVKVAAKYSGIDRTDELYKLEHAYTFLINFCVSTPTHSFILHIIVLPIMASILEHVYYCCRLHQSWRRIVQHWVV